MEKHNTPFKSNPKKTSTKFPLRRRGGFRTRFKIGQYRSISDVEGQSGPQFGGRSSETSAAFELGLYSGHIQEQVIS